MIESKYQILAIVVLTILFVGCNNSFGNHKNPLYGQTYKHHEEIQELKDYKMYAGMVIDVQSKIFKFGFDCIQKDKKIICILDEMSAKHDSSGLVTHKILDTINVTIKDDEFFTLGYNFIIQDTIFDLTIVGLIKGTSIIKAWRADTLTGTFKPIKDLSKIKYFEEEGCDDYYDEDFEDTETDSIK